MHPADAVPVLVGRAAERAALDAALGAPDRGRPRLVLVAGEAGSGKSLLVQAVLAGRPDRDAVVVRDDLQWASGSDLDHLFDDAASSAADAGARMVVGCYRPEEVGPGHPLRRARARLRRVAEVHEVTLRPLSAAEVSALVTRTFPGLPRGGLDAVVARADGVPFLALELARCRLGAPPGGADDLPDSVLDAVLLQADRLDPPCRAALDAAAVAGPDFEVALVDALAGGPGTGTLEACAGAGFVVLSADGASGSFRHRIVRDALVAGLAPARRRQLHLVLARLLDDAGAPPGEIAQHASAGGDDVLAARALLAAARACAAAFDDRGAVRALRACLRHRPAQRLEVLALLAASLERLGRPTESLDLLREVVAGLRAVEADDRLAEALDRLARAAETQGDWTTSLAARAEAAAVWSRLGRPDLAATQRLTAAAHLRSAAAFSAAVPLLRLARGEAVLAGDEGLVARIDALHGNVLARAGDPAGVALVRTALHLAVGRGLMTVAAEVYQRLGDCLEHTGDYPGAQQAYAAAADFCLTHGQDGAGQLCRACAGYVIFQRGDWDAAVALDREVLGAATSGEHARAAAGAVLGLVLALRGRRSSARRALVTACAAARHATLIGPTVLAGWGLAVLADTAGDTTRTVALVRALLDTCDGTQERHYSLPSLHWSMTALARRGATDDVRRIAGRLIALAEPVPDDEAQAAADHACAEIALLDGDLDSALRSFARAEGHAQAAGLPFTLAVVRGRAGEALTAAGQRQEAERVLRAGRRTAAQLGATPTTVLFDTLLAALGSPAERPAGALGGLTRREAEVLAKVADGLTSRQIAADLVLSIRTVDMHVANAMAKLGCRTRAHAASVSRELARGPGAAGVTGALAGGRP